ncbi:MAG: HAD family hydrolase [Thermodesulfobacteriota bacterium]
MMPFRPQKIKGVIFDLDQTIIDSLGALTEAFNTGTGKFGLEPVTGERIAHFLDEGLRLGEILLELFPSVFEEDGKRQACGDVIRKAYFELEPQKVMLKPGVKPTLESLKEGGVTWENMKYYSNSPLRRVPSRGIFTKEKRWNPSITG